MSDPSYALELRHVTKRFGALTAVNDLSLSLESGSIFGLLGPNGSGKTTLLRMIMGLVKVSEGDILLWHKHRPGSHATRSQLGYMPQHFAVYPALSIRENVLFYGRLYGVPRSELNARVASILNMVELESVQDRRIDQLSGGMVRRAMLATCLIHAPKLLILDEPTAGVDPALRLKFWDWFSELTAQGMTIIITTHHISEAVRCNRVAFVREGSIIDDAPPRVLMDRYHTTDLEAAFVVATRAQESKSVS